MCISKICNAAILGVAGVKLVRSRRRVKVKSGESSICVSYDGVCIKICNAGGYIGGSRSHQVKYRKDYEKGSTLQEKDKGEKYICVI